MRAKRSLEWDIMLGQVAGYRKQGKPRMRWLDSIQDATSLRLAVLKKKNSLQYILNFTKYRQDTEISHGQ